MDIKNFKDEVMEIIDEKLKEYEDNGNTAKTAFDQFMYSSRQLALLNIKSKILHLYMDKYMKGGDE